MPKAPRLVIRFLLAFGLAFGLAAAAPSVAAAQAEPAAAEPAAPAAEAAEPSADPAAEGWGDQRVRGVRSKGPAQPDAGAYNWVFMAFAGVVVVATGLVLLRIIRKSARQDA